MTQGADGRGVEVVALVTSVGGLAALSGVLRVLPPDFPAAVAVAQHLGGQGSVLVDLLARRIALPVGWARDGGRIEPGTVTVCPPRSVLEVLPDRTCAVRPAERVFADRPLDTLLASVGDSFAGASLAVVLTGMGSDGVVGATAVRAAGGFVIAQSEETAEQPAMPAAAGAVDLVLPLYDIGPAVVDAALGRRLPLAPTEAQAIRATFGTEGVMAGHAAALDWSRAPRADSRRAALAGAMAILADAADLLFSVAYRLDAPSTRAGLVAASGVEAGGPLAPRELRPAPGSAWPLPAGTGPKLVGDLAARFPGHLLGAGDVPPESAVVHPLRDDAENRVVGLLILGLDPYLNLDDRYREFLSLVGGSVESRMADADARQRERQRLERLAELDRAKTEFFSNVSHEFRTPLTLMLGPLDELGRDGDGPSARQRADVDLVRRNARRLQRLVGTMLDCSQIEAGRLRAVFAPVDLAERTREIVGQFDGAAERAGLALRTDLPALPAVWADAEMWEKIVSNLLSNALKFTFAGEIAVSLRGLAHHAELVVRDTGVGIAAEELPHVFKRFHRVRGGRARTHEGAGIGLALVDELVRRHHGRAAQCADAAATGAARRPAARDRGRAARSGGRRGPRGTRRPWDRRAAAAAARGRGRCRQGPVGAPADGARVDAGGHRARRGDGRARVGGGRTRPPPRRPGVRARRGSGPSPRPHPSASR